MKSDESQGPQSLAEVLNPPQRRDSMWDLMETLRPGPKPLPGTGEVPADIDVMEHRWAIPVYAVLKWIGRMLILLVVLAVFIVDLALMIAVLLGILGLLLQGLGFFIKK